MISRQEIKKPALMCEHDLSVPIELDQESITVGTEVLGPEKIPLIQKANKDHNHPIL
jgi:hypothetical protein